MKRLLIVLLLLFLPTLSVSAPVAPELSYEASETSITLNWTPVPGALGYRLYYAPYPFAGMNTIGSLDMGSEVSASYLLWENAAYYIAIKAFDETSESDYSNIEFFIMGPPTPEWVDDDGDGFNEIEGDCNDDALDIYPGAPETCGDGIAQDCSLNTDPACFVVAQADTLRQFESNLIWQRVHLDPAEIGRTEVNWHSGADYCRRLTLAGYTDWRLPTKIELESLFDTSYTGNIDPLFEGTEKASYWTSTEVSEYSVYDVNFGTGQVGVKGKQTVNSLVRCVRGEE